MGWKIMDKSIEMPCVGLVDTVEDVEPNVRSKTGERRIVEAQEGTCLASFGGAALTNVRGMTTQASVWKSSVLCERGQAFSCGQQGATEGLGKERLGLH